MVTGSGPDDTGRILLCVRWEFAQGRAWLSGSRIKCGKTALGLRGYAKHHSRLPGQAER